MPPHPHHTPHFATPHFTSSRLAPRINITLPSHSTPLPSLHTTALASLPSLTPTARASRQVRSASFECLHEIANYYYSKLQPYMTEIYNITVKAIKEDTQDVGLQVGHSKNGGLLAGRVGRKVGG